MFITGGMFYSFHPTFTDIHESTDKWLGFVKGAILV
jgi:hypothetical protein